MWLNLTSYNGKHIICLWEYIPFSRNRRKRVRKETPSPAIKLLDFCVINSVCIYWTRKFLMKKMIEKGQQSKVHKCGKLFNEIPLSNGWVSAEYHSYNVYYYFIIVNMMIQIIAKWSSWGCRPSLRLSHVQTFHEVVFLACIA